MEKHAITYQDVEPFEPGAHADYAIDNPGAPSFEYGESLEHERVLRQYDTFQRCVERLGEVCDLTDDSERSERVRNVLRAIYCEVGNYDLLVNRAAFDEIMHRTFGENNAEQ